MNKITKISLLALISLVSAQALSMKNPKLDDVYTKEDYKNFREQAEIFRSYSSQSLHESCIQRAKIWAITLFVSLLDQELFLAWKNTKMHQIGEMMDKEMFKARVQQWACEEQEKLKQINPNLTSTEKIKILKKKIQEVKPEFKKVRNSYPYFLEPSQKQKSKEFLGAQVLREKLEGNDPSSLINCMVKDNQYNKYKMALAFRNHLSYEQENTIQEGKTTEQQDPFLDCWI